MNRILTIVIMLGWAAAFGQNTVVYTVNEGFNTLELLRGQGGISDIYPLEDGGFF
jgi:peroxiredoxin family protein